MADERADLMIEFLRTSVFGDDPATLEPDTKLISEAVLDSMGLVMLLAFVEERFGVQIPDADVRGGEIDSIADIIGYLDRTG